MSTGQVLLAVAAALFLYLFATGTSGLPGYFLDLGVAARDLPYLAAIPCMAVFTIYMLRV